MELDFEPLERAETIIAKEAKHGRDDGTFAVTQERREQLRDLILLSQAQSLKRIADMLDGTTVGIDVSETILGRRAG